MIEEITKSDWNNCSIPERYIDNQYLMGMKILNSFKPQDKLFRFRDEDLIMDGDLLIYVYGKECVSYKSYTSYEYDILKYVLKELDNSLFSINMWTEYGYSDEGIITEKGNTLSVNLKLDKDTMISILNSLDKFHRIHSCGYVNSFIIDNGVIMDRYDKYGDEYGYRNTKAIFINNYRYNVKKLYSYYDTLCLEISNYLVHSKDEIMNIKSNFVSKYIRDNKVSIFKDLLSLLGVPSDLLNNIN